MKWLSLLRQTLRYYSCLPICLFNLRVLLSIPSFQGRRFGSASFNMLHTSWDHFTFKGLMFRNIAFNTGLCILDIKMVFWHFILLWCKRFRILTSESKFDFCFTAVSFKLRLTWEQYDIVTSHAYTFVSHTFFLLAFPPPFWKQSLLEHPNTMLSRAERG